MRKENVKKHIVELVIACVIIHNLMIDYKDKIPQDWYDEFIKENNWDIYDKEYSADEDEDCTVDNDMNLDRRKEVFKSIQNFYMKFCNICFNL